MLQRLLQAVGVRLCAQSVVGIGVSNDRPTGWPIGQRNTANGQLERTKP